MGIKFHCPNGHKMNVKSFLAGKKGVCPKCGVGVEVPMVSEGEAAPVGQPQAAAQVGSAMAETMAEDLDFPSIGMASGVDAETDFPSSLGAINTNGKAEVKFAAAPMPEVIAKDPLALWYTCTQSGDRYGPVSGEALNKWLEEGRVSASSLVWREGWPEWQRASAVFPSLSPKGRPAVDDFSDMFPGLTASKPAAESTPTEAKSTDDLLADVLSGATTASFIPTSRRRTYKDKVVLMSMILIGAAIFLGVALMLVLLNRN